MHPRRPAALLGEGGGGWPWEVRAGHPARDARCHGSVGPGPRPPRSSEPGPRLSLNGPDSAATRPAWGRPRPDPCAAR